MKTPVWPARVAVGLLVLSAAMFAGALWLKQFNPAVDQSQTQVVGHYLSFMACGALGGLLAARRPNNVVGWTFLAIGMIAGLTVLSMEYAHYGLLTSPGSLPRAGVAAWMQTWTWSALMGGFFYVLLVFPSGSLPSRRWRTATVLLGVGVALVAVAEQLRPVWHIGQNEWGLAVPNAFGLGAGEGVVGVVEAAGLVTASVAMVLAVVCIVIRYRRARGVERMQVKWVAYGAVVAVTSTVLVDSLPVPAAVSDLSSLLFAVLPATAVIAVMRYRLYDLERLVSRTVTYTVVIAALAGLYALGVVGLGRGLVAITGRSPGDVAVAASTLAVAAAFRPVRRRVQEVVDRRFNRSRYDSTKLIEAFAARLRDQVDVDALAADLHDVAVASVRPAAASLWWAPRTEVPR